MCLIQSHLHHDHELETNIYMRTIVWKKSVVKNFMQKNFILISLCTSAISITICVCITILYNVICLVRVYAGPVPLVFRWSG